MEKYNKKIIFFGYFIPVLAWTGVIFYFSSIPNLHYSQKVYLEIILRKGAHFLEYAVLAFLLWRMFFKILGTNYNKTYFLSFLTASLYSVSDEFHQTFISGRMGKIEDVLFDIISVFISLQFIFLFKKKRKIKNILFFIMITLLILLGIGYKMAGEDKIAEDQRENQQMETEPEEESAVNQNKKIENEDVEIKKENGDILENGSNDKIPEKIKINVPFTSQAPFAKWDEYHEEACEEASLIMIKYYLDGKTLDKNISEKEIQNMIKFQIKKYGDYKDTNAKKTTKLAEDFYEINNLKVIYDFKVEDIKKNLAKGKPIIVPAAGRKLGNPNFTPPGPLYHNLVLIGYDGNIIITNDPGTRKGKDYTYNLFTLYNAIHDFPGKPEDIEKGRKAMIIIE